MFKRQPVLLSQMISFRGTAPYIVYPATKLFGEVFEHGSSANYHFLFFFSAKIAIVSCRKACQQQ